MPKTVNAMRMVCTRGLVTRASTIAAPVGRSAIDSSKLILIMPFPLLSTRDRRQLPYQERSLSCSPGQISLHLPVFAGRDQTLQPVSQSVLRGNLAAQEVWNLRQQ